MSRWLGRALLGMTMTLALAATASAATPLERTAKDRVGDAADPQLDLHSASFSYDRETGDLAGVVTLGAEPTDAVVATVSFYFGRYSKIDGECWPPSEEVFFFTPEPGNLNGFTHPYAKLYKYEIDDAIGSLTSSSTGGELRFSTVGASEAVHDALRGRRWNCVEIVSAEAGTYKTADSIGPINLVDGPARSCTPVDTSLSVGQSLRLRCQHVRGKVVVRVFKPGSRRFFKGTDKVKHGRLSLPTVPILRGTCNFSIWKNGIMVGRFTARIR